MNWNLSWHANMTAGSEREQQINLSKHLQKQGILIVFPGNARYYLVHKMNV